MHAAGEAWQIYIGVALQLVGVMVQWHFVGNPEWCSQYSVGGDAEGGGGWQSKLTPGCTGGGSTLARQQGPLQHVLAVSLFLQLALALGVWSYMLGTFPAARGLDGLGGWLVAAIRYCSFGLAAQRFLFLSTAIYLHYANVRWPLEHWLLVFAPLFSISSFVIQTLSFRDFALVYPASLILCLWALSLHWPLALDTFYLRVLVSALIVGLAAVRTNLYSRGFFQLQLIFFVEMKHMRAILLDLLPRDIVRKNFTLEHILKEAGGQADGEGLTRLICPRQEREAVVLAFDVSCFTQLCRSEGDLGIATIMHHIFSSFDTAVKNSTVEGLFKMDTIGLPICRLACTACTRQRSLA